RSPFFETAYNCQQLLVIDLVVAFGRRVLLGVEGHWVQGTAVVTLGQDSGGYIVRGVCFHQYFAVRVEVSKDWCCRELLLECCKGRFAGGVPFEFDSFTSKVDKGCHHSRVP